jgi:peroxiredoxin
MIAEGSKAPGFELADHFGRKISLGSFAGKHNVMLLFYPLDFTPT